MLNSLITSLLDLVLDKYTSDDVSELANHYYSVDEKDGMETAWERFTDRFELGNWFYEQAILKEINLVDVLENVKTLRLMQQGEAAEDRAEREQEYRSMVGGGSP